MGVTWRLTSWRQRDLHAVVGRTATLKIDQKTTGNNTLALAA